MKILLTGLLVITTVTSFASDRVELRLKDLTEQECDALKDKIKINLSKSVDHLNLQGTGAVFANYNEATFNAGYPFQNTCLIEVIYQNDDAEIVHGDQSTKIVKNKDFIQLEKDAELMLEDLVRDGSVFYAEINHHRKGILGNKRQISYKYLQLKLKN